MTNINLIPFQKQNTKISAKIRLNRLPKEGQERRSMLDLMKTTQGDLRTMSEIIRYRKSCSNITQVFVKRKLPRRVVVCLVEIVRVT